jgi:hypothetical protein
MILILLYLNYLRVLLIKLGPYDGRRFQYPRVHPGGITWMFVRITRPGARRNPGVRVAQWQSNSEHFAVAKSNTSQSMT